MEDRQAQGGTETLEPGDGHMLVQSLGQEDPLDWKWIGNSNLLQYSCLEIPMDRGAWWATVHGAAKVRQS